MKYKVTHKFHDGTIRTMNGSFIGIKNTINTVTNV